jgi:hypothetical protein
MIYQNQWWIHAGKNTRLLVARNPALDGRYPRVQPHAQPPLPLGYPIKDIISIHWRPSWRKKKTDGAEKWLVECVYMYVVFRVCIVRGINEAAFEMISVSL